MTFRATQRPNWAGGIFCLTMTGALIVLGLYLLSRLTPRDPPLARLMGIAPFAIALVSLGVAGTLMYDSLYPKVLTLDAESIRLSRGQKVIGQVPFANVVTVGIDWTRPKT